MEVAAVMAIALANEGGNPPDWKDFIGIFVTFFIVNSTISFIKENNASNLAIALMDHLSLRARALRDRRSSDVISIKLGDILATDARLLERGPLEIDQSALTGEASAKTVYSGSSCIQGEIATGIHSYFGDVAPLVDSTNKQGHFHKVLAAIRNFFICTIALVMLIQISVMYPIQNRSYQSVINNSLVLLTRGYPLAMPIVLYVTMTIGSHGLSQQILNLAHGGTAIWPLVRATITKFAKRGLRSHTVAYQIYAIFIAIRFVIGYMLPALTWKLDFPPSMVVIIAILNNGTIMAIHKDGVKQSPQPGSWKLDEILATGIVFGVYLAVIMAAFFWAAFETSLFQRGSPADLKKVASAVYLQVRTISQALIFAVRARNWSLMERPGLVIMLAFLYTQMVVTTIFIAVYTNWGYAAIQGIGWKWAGVFWSCNLVLYISLDFIKLLVQYAITGKAWDHLLERKATFTSRRRKIPTGLILWILAIWGGADLHFAAAFPVRADEGHESYVLRHIMTLLAAMVVVYLLNKLFRRVQEVPRISGTKKLGGDDESSSCYYSAVDDESSSRYYSAIDESNSIAQIHNVQTGSTQYESYSDSDDSITSYGATPVDGRPNIMVLLDIYAILGAIVKGYTGSLLGAIFSMPPFLYRTSRFLYHEQELARNNNYCQYNSLAFIILTSIIPICSMFMGWVALFLSRMFGRKFVSYMACVLIIIGTCLVITLDSIPSIVGLVCIGCGVGLCSMIVPAICSECAPKELKRHFSVLCGYQAIGSALASVVSFMVAYHQEKGWIASFIILAFLSILLAGVTYFLEETPLYFIESMRDTDAYDTLVRLRNGRLGWEIIVEWNELTVVTPRQEDYLKTFFIKLAASVLPQLVSIVPVTFFGPLVASSLTDKLPSVSFLISLIGSILGLGANLLTSRLLPILGRRIVFVGAGLLAVVSTISLFVIFWIYVHDTVNITRGATIAATFMMILNYVAVAVLTNPHGWINTSLGGTRGSLLLDSLNSATTVSKNYYSVSLTCEIRAWGFFLDFVWGVLCVAFLYIFVF